MSSAKEQTAARYVVQFLLEDGMAMITIALKTGIQKRSLEAFYRCKDGSDLTPSEIGKLEKLHEGVKV